MSYVHLIQSGATSSRRHRFGRVLTASLAAGTLFLSGCSSDDTATASDDSSSSGPITIRVGSIAKVPIYWGIYGAQALGYLDDEKVKLDIITVDEPGCMRGLISDSVDVCLSGFDSVARAAEAHTGVKVVATLVDPTINSLVVDPKQVKDWSDLSGTAIAAQAPGVASSIRISALLEANGVDPSSVDFLTVGGTSDRYAALVAGKVSGAIVSQPEDLKAAKQGYKLLGKTDDASTTFGTYVSTVPGRSAEMDDGVKRLVNAIHKALGWFGDPANEKKAVEYLESEYDMDPEFSKPVYDILLPTLGKPTISADQIERDLKIVEKFGDIKVDLPVQDFYDEALSSGK